MRWSWELRAALSWSCCPAHDPVPSALLELGHRSLFPGKPLPRAFVHWWSCILGPEGSVASKALCGVGSVTHALGSSGASPEEQERERDAE